MWREDRHKSDQFSGDFKLNFFLVLRQKMTEVSIQKDKKVACFFSKKCGKNFISLLDLQPQATEDMNKYAK